MCSRSANAYLCSGRKTKKKQADKDECDFHVFCLKTKIEVKKMGLHVNSYSQVCAGPEGKAEKVNRYFILLMPFPLSFPDYRRRRVVVVVFWNETHRITVSHSDTEALPGRYATA